MTCPEVERLVEVALGQSADPELEAHVQRCEDCRADLLTIEALAGVGGPDREISEGLVSRIVAGLPKPEPRVRRTWGGGGQLLLTWGLGFLTALVSAGVTGSVGALDPGTVLMLATAFGAASVLFTRLNRRDRAPATREPSRPRPD